MSYINKGQNNIGNNVQNNNNSNKNVNSNKNGYGENQQQIYYQSQIQQQSEIRYYVYQDLQNIINLIYSRNAVLEHFKNDPNHPMVTLINNKMLLQLNLSNTIQLDQTQQYQRDSNLFDFLKQERMNANRILKNVIFNQKKDSIQTALIEYSNDYQNGNFKLNKQYKLQETGLVAKFDESVLSKILSSIQNVDYKINQLRNGQIYDVPKELDIIKKAENYQIQAKQLLQINFHLINTGEKSMVQPQNLNQNQYTNIANGKVLKPKP
ncbi:unnamed protein product [Paramecium sonneborni]|uniref:Uncharacterized protein n=1 Tax=Paramecium sonneborni TaxID=65129 RepID=A0A8S1RLZ5_9CILI|nr:unnamed protein product [Paramecium sonneborni]